MKSIGVVATVRAAVLVETSAQANSSSGGSAGSTCAPNAADRHQAIPQHIFVFWAIWLAAAAILAHVCLSCLTDGLQSAAHCLCSARTAAAALDTIEQMPTHTHIHTNMVPLGADV